MISHTQRFFSPPGLLPPLPYTANPLRALSRSVEDIHFDLNRNALPDRPFHDNSKLFYDFKNKNMGGLPYLGRNNTLPRPCYSPYPNMSPFYYKTSPERKDLILDRNLSLKSMWPMDHVGEYCAELLNRDKHYWTDEETGLMLELYEENKDYFNDNKTKKTKLWSVIANIINKRFNTNVNSEQCSQKYRNLKAEFLKIADPTSLDGGAKKFGRHFVQMKRLVEADEKSAKGNQNNWPVKEELGESQNTGKGEQPMENDEVTVPDNSQLDRIQLTNSPPSQTQSNIPIECQTAVPLSIPMSIEPSNILTTKIDTRPVDERRIDLMNPNHQETVSDNRCMIETTTNINQGLRNKTQCLIDNVTNINQVLRDKTQCLIDNTININQDLKGKKQCLINNATNINQGLGDNTTNIIQDIREKKQYSSDNETNMNQDSDKTQCLIDNTIIMNQVLRDKNEYLVDSSASMNQTTRNISPCIETASEIVLSNSPKREVLIKISPQEAEVLNLPRPPLNLKSQGAGMLKLPRPPLNLKCTEPLEHNYSSSKYPTTDVPNDERIDFHESTLNDISSYSNELNQIFNEYFLSRGKELELYESKERQNIVCMNKCIDVFRKIMMEKIN